jgi:hypothetical protein
MGTSKNRRYPKNFMVARVSSLSHSRENPSLLHGRKTLKKPIHLLLLALLFIIGCACAITSTQSRGAQINPGDRIGDFLITTGTGENSIFLTRLHCPFDGNTGTQTCNEPVGTMVNVGLGIFDNDPFKGMTLNEFWSQQTCEMLIEGRPVNLRAFGSIDFFHPVLGTMRVWNVSINTDHPGTIAVHSKGMAGGDPFDNVAVLTFTAP